ncbi:MAG: hypothetical protein KME16_21215 [Scytolyngbya sp. HA4215-MV1]|jgi:hypothetical protein|nr:hypothetical protein [Scytolyngbya sp. HA4215-MV1]
MALLDDLVKIGVPLLASVLGGPPRFAAGAIGLVTRILGLANNSSLKDIAKEIQTNPDAALKLRELEVNYQQYLASVRLQMDQAEYADRASARSREVEITKATGRRDWYVSVLGTSVVLAFAVVLGIMIINPTPKQKRDPYTDSLMNILIGALTAGFSTVLGYYFGSSAGSRNKDDTIANLSADVTESPNIPTPLLPIVPPPLPAGSVSRSSLRDE